MAYVSLARKWRPRRFADLVGQTSIRTTLENSLAKGQVHQALLFTGTRGVGKTTIARILARCLNCESADGAVAEPCGTCSACVSIDEGRFPDLFEIDAASRTKVDDTRELLDNIPYAPVRGRVKVYLIDEVHMLSKSSFNALLKTLEEPPPHVQFLLATTDPHKLPITVLSRCLQFPLARIPLNLMIARLQEICEAEGVATDADGLDRIARAGDGSLRDALSLLDQAIAFGGGQVSGAQVANMLGTIERSEVLDLIDAVAGRNIPRMLQVLDHCAERGLDFSTLLSELARAWQTLALAQVLPEGVDPELSAEMTARVDLFEPADVQVFYQIACHARRDLDWAPDPRSGTEMALLRMLAFLPEEATPGKPRPEPKQPQAESVPVAPQVAAAPTVAAPCSAPAAARPSMSSPPAPEPEPASAVTAAPAGALRVDTPPPVRPSEVTTPPSAPVSAVADVPSVRSADDAAAEMSPMERQFRALPMVQALEQEFGPGLAVRNIHSRAGDDAASPLD